jgi:hypothetical protein
MQSWTILSDFQLTTMCTKNSVQALQPLQSFPLESKPPGYGLRLSAFSHVRRLLSSSSLPEASSHTPCEAFVYFFLDPSSGHTFNALAQLVHNVFGFRCRVFGAVGLPM